MKQRHGDLIAFDKLRSQEGHPGEKKKKKKLVQREVLSLATVKTNVDTNEHPIMAHNVPIIVHDARRKSPIITTSRVDPLAWPSNLTTSPSMDTLETFDGSTSSLQDPKNGMPRPPFNVDYPNVPSTANHRVQAMDAINADFQVIANVNRSATIARGMIADKLRMRANCMALVEESRPMMTQMNDYFPPRQLHLPFCQPIQDERCIGMMLCRPTIDQVSTEEGRLAN